MNTKVSKQLTCSKSLNETKIQYANGNKLYFMSQKFLTRRKQRSASLLYLYQCKYEIVKKWTCINKTLFSPQSCTCLISVRNSSFRLFIYLFLSIQSFTRIFVCLYVYWFLCLWYSRCGCDKVIKNHLSKIKDESNSNQFHSLLRVCQHKNSKIQMNTGNITQLLVRLG